MSKVRIIKYDERQRLIWNDFLSASKNGIFLFHRNYMEYHADRFTDFSLLFVDDKDKLIAVMPANIQASTLISHQGLTFGGVVSDASMKTALMLELFAALKIYLKAEGLARVKYKAVPHIYHRLPAEEDLYALYRDGARLISREVSSAIDMHERLQFSSGRKWAVKQGKKSGLDVGRSFDFKGFMAIEEELLGSKYKVKPVHSIEEIRLLADRFPDNIKLFTARKGDELMGGVIVYESQRVAHAQYISATDEGKRIGALDVILDLLINDYYRSK